MHKYIILLSVFLLSACGACETSSSTEDKEKEYEVRCYSPSGEEIYYGVGDDVDIYSDDLFRLWKGREIILDTTMKCLASKRW